ncbi:hypothetical protein CANCADRAFT_42445 [Tortispora caseinolytica NRRL Y-17796]|uniref:Uncharacterized protein n=1 Tax=Tortispora caseinolytica NRRL Y-17796 TaxID=767744 RepID=A0A1E4TJ83_9ASCO|nr:hypothetical protein CANCADRAFT_42445 [Tortispora caseinolytica NRRL Y-17796]
MATLSLFSRKGTTPQSAVDSILNISNSSIADLQDAFISIPELGSIPPSIIPSCIPQSFDHPDALLLANLCTALQLYSNNDQQRIDTVNEIQELSESDQAQIRDVIELIASLAHNPANSVDELANLYSKYSELDARYHDLQAAHAQTEEQLMQLKQQQERQQPAIAIELPAAPQTNSDSVILELENKLQATTDELVSSKKQLTALTKKIATLESETSKLATLQEELDQARIQAEQNQKLTNVIEKYKEKLSRTADLERELSSAQDELVDVKLQLTALQKDKKQAETIEPSTETHAVNNLDEATTKIFERERRLMASAWYANSVRMNFPTTTFSRKSSESPQSWLNRQRKALDGAL